MLSRCSRLERGRLKPDVANALRLLVKVFEREDVTGRLDRLERLASERTGEFRQAIAVGLSVATVREADARPKKFHWLHRTRQAAEASRDQPGHDSVTVRKE